MSNTLISKHKLPTPTTLNEHLVSKTHPSWLEHILRLAQARGYWTIYPNFENQDALATVHTDLYQPPEEYAEEPAVQPSDSAELTADPSKHLQQKEPKLLTTSLLNILPFRGILPKIYDLPMMTWDGHKVIAVELVKLAEQYSQVFKREIGGCIDDELKRVKSGTTTSDLFCLDELKV